MNFIFDRYKLSVSQEQMNYFKTVVINILTNEFEELISFIYEIVLTADSDSIPSNEFTKDSLAGGYTLYDNSKVFYYSLLFKEMSLTFGFDLPTIIRHEFYHCRDSYYFFLRNNSFDKSFEYLIFDEFKNIHHFKKSFCMIYWSEYFAYRQAYLTIQNSNIGIQKAILNLNNLLNGYHSIIQTKTYEECILIYPKIKNDYIHAIFYQISKELGYIDNANNNSPIAFSNPISFVEVWCNDLQGILRQLFNEFYNKNKFNALFDNYINKFFEIFIHYHLQFLCSGGQPSLQIFSPN